ncbi:CapA family protein [Streptomyces spirodelae]|uniref:CapA family protein n=1 Tax=Streptomyces spirodelae TaxID=2812904 RepID=A0ABS3X3K1_9ACTN|nr:CapA family protein [Streptomyces spirodelae]MBO8189956.1 CapA family protein [Streptomyces spirodelae]
MSGNAVTLALTGDVMLGRGVDQILPYPGDPALREPCVRDAGVYLELAEAENGPVPRPADFAWPWGEALRTLDELAPDVRICNLETSVTRSGDFAPCKDVHYRMSPANVAALAVARPEVTVLANNHVLDFGVAGLLETLDTLSEAGLRTAGAGRNAAEARTPATAPVGAGGGRVLVGSVGSPSSGIPGHWAATDQRPGLRLVLEASPADAADVCGQLAGSKGAGDLAVASVHWGSNWGYEVPPEQVRFAHALIDGGVDLVHGHSSHHPRPVELYRGRPVLYGCGDFIDDYEGISGHAAYRDDLRLLHTVTLDTETGSASDVRLIPFQARRMRLVRASPADTEWLRVTLDRISTPFGARVETDPTGTLVVRPRTSSRRGGDQPRSA